MKKIYFLLVSFCLFTGVNAQIVNIPDANFKAKLLAANSNNTIAKNLAGAYFKIDANSDGQIQQSEALNVSFLDVAYNYNIYDMTGIESFINLITLYCSSSGFSSLNLSSNTALVTLDCSGSQLTSLNLSNNLSLATVNCNANQLTTFNASGLTALTSLDCGDNQLTSLNVNGCSNLVTLLCNENNLTALNLMGLNTLQILSCTFNALNSLNVGGCSSLLQIYCDHNQLSNLDLNGLNSLTELYCSNNLFQKIDISNLPALNSFKAYGNNLLTAILMKYNGLNQYDMYYDSNINSNPNLRYICVEDARRSIVISDLLGHYGITGVEVNSYCSFVPSNPFYVIQGNNKFDSNNNGCDAADIAFPFFKLRIVNSSVTRDYLSGISGNYYIPVASGTNVVSPVLENPTYFNVSPTTRNISFPSQASPVTQDFCITANGTHPDLEITLLPINPARPGFDTNYKLVYKNKGNQTQSGTVNLMFNDAVLDFISANPATSNQAVNNLSWNFTNLQPFETREIAITLNVNSPTETPAINNGDILNYTATITSPATDEMPNDNTFTFNQTVVNSFDPNDKTCLEGATIAPSEVGKYVHYMIRFENNGTANAQNIVVKDMIDTNKFDINSLVPIKGSHSFITNITSGNKVEFIFENINLPFDDANNDGYVAFKIKTKPTLVVGNTFSNSASIYFDYNFPIVTNTATTTIQALSNQDFGFATYFALYPNPVKDVLNIETKQSIQVSSINIYNQLGQLVLVVPNAQNVKTVDVSGLASGNYFIKIKSDKGTSNTKFIKL